VRRRKIYQYQKKSIWWREKKKETSPSSFPAIVFIYNSSGYFNK